MLTQPDLDSIEERAQRLLDGMTVNHAAFAREVMRISKELRHWRNSKAERNPDVDQACKDLWNTLFTK